MKNAKNDMIFMTLNHIVLFIVLVVTLYPILYVVSASFSDPYYVNSGQLWLLPKGLTLEGYGRVFRDNSIFTGYRNTIFYTVVGLIINLFITLPAAFSLSNNDFSAKGTIGSILAITMFISGGLIPLYLVIQGLGMINTVWSVLLPVAASMYNIIITRTFFANSIPFELQEAAKIDGCSVTRTFLNIVLPLSKPIIAVMCLYYGTMHWNSYFNAMIFLNNRKLYPLQLFIREILVENQMSDIMVEDQGWAEQIRINDMIKYCVIVISTLPVVMGYLFTQKYFVQGVMIGAVKG